MYMTTSNVIGALKPNVATFTAERRARNQGFSNSFQGVKYRNRGAATAVTKSKSNVHEKGRTKPRPCAAGIPSRLM